MVMQGARATAVLILYYFHHNSSVLTLGGCLDIKTAYYQQWDLRYKDITVSWPSHNYEEVHGNRKDGFDIETGPKRITLFLVSLYVTMCIQSLHIMCVSCNRNRIRLSIGFSSLDTYATTRVIVCCDTGNYIRNTYNCVSQRNSSSSIMFDTHRNMIQFFKCCPLRRLAKAATSGFGATIFGLKLWYRSNI